MVRSYQESHVPKKNFIVKFYLARKNLKGSQQKPTYMETYIVRVCRKLVENNSPNATRRKQLVEIKRRKTGRKLTGRLIIKCKLVEYLQITHWDDSVLIMIKFSLIDA